MFEIKMLKIILLVTAAAVACDAKKLRGHETGKTPRKLGRFWIPGSALNGSGYSIYTGSNDFAPLVTEKPTRKPSNKPTNEPTTWNGDAYPTLSPTLT